MTAKAIRYAEEDLGVHKVSKDVDQYLIDLDDELADLDNAQEKRRRLEDEYADREVELIGEMRSTHPSYSDTRFKSEFKNWERLDKELKRIRLELFRAREEANRCESTVELTKQRIKAGCARMEQLGGYFHYLAVVKAQAEKTTKKTEDK